MKDDLVPSSIGGVSAKATDSAQIVSDSVVVEEPLEVRVKQLHVEHTLGITMRTPGADIDLAAGFLLSEGVIDSVEEVVQIKVCGDRSLTPRQRANIVIAELSEDTPRLMLEKERKSVISSACGICGSTSISDLHARGTKPVATSTRNMADLGNMPALFAGRQHIFERTGGLHGALLVDGEGEVRWSREDVGRHNAVDKVIGAAFLAHELPLASWTLVVSGRVGFEIVQKAIVAGISALVAVSAPTSLAIELANEFNLTLLAFAREGRAMQYSPLLG